MPASVLSPSALVLVTGANGLIASHTVEQLLKAGYKARGTTRSAEKLAALKKRWDDIYGADKFEIVVVKDLLVEGALEEAMEGVSAVAHIASVVNFSINYDEVVPPTIKMTLNVLKSAAKFPGIKRVVLTSSSTAGQMPTPDVPEIFIDETTWNDAIVEAVKTMPEDDPQRGFAVYAASKTLAEREAWSWMAENKPSFEFNTVLPYYAVGRILDEAGQANSTAGWTRDWFEGKPSFFASIPAQYFVNTQDIGLIHLGALTLPSVSSSRIWGAAAPCNLDDISAVFRKLHPSRTFSDDANSGTDLSVVDTTKGTAILKAFGQERWTGLEASLEQLVGRE